MRNIKIILLSAALMLIACLVALEIGDSIPSGNSSISSEPEQVVLNFHERRTRSASLKIITPTGGHGTGTLFDYNGMMVIFTAAHVTTEGPIYLAQDRWGEQRFAVLVYVDPKVDFAVLAVDPFEKTAPVKFRLPRYNLRDKIDLEVIFSGYPSQHDLMTMRGSVAGFEGPSMIVNSSAWSGSSGSSVFDSEGKFIGILYGVSLASSFTGPRALENFIWVMPNHEIKWQELSIALSEIYKEK
jgi:hypothetical protein